MCRSHKRWATIFPLVFIYLFLFNLYHFGVVFLNTTTCWTVCLISAVCVSSYSNGCVCSSYLMCNIFETLGISLMIIIHFYEIMKLKLIQGFHVTFMSWNVDSQAVCSVTWISIPQLSCTGIFPCNETKIEDLYRIFEDLFPSWPHSRRLLYFLLIYLAKTQLSAVVWKTWGTSNSRLVGCSWISGTDPEKGLENQSRLISCSPGSVTRCQLP